MTMATELNKFFQARRKFGIDMTEASALFGEQRALEFGNGSRLFTADDAHRMETLAGQKARDRQESKKAESARLRALFGR